MENLSHKELLEINGGNIEKERTSFGATVDAVAGIITGAAGLIASWFN